MRQIFVDTNALVALGHQKDQYHNDATKIYKNLISEGFSFVITNYIIDESVTFLS